ncbi:hypothetical protein B0H21DRAFT_821639 [Amylocystis lapponica]|nr:hypothetical protein B0H21DRAFT_821639 [Amylocystis lapponica]
MQLVLPFILMSCASAAPSQQLVRRSTGSVAIYVPIVVVVLLIVVLLVVACSGRNMRSRFAAWSASAAIASGTVAATSSGVRPTVLTADQLAGTQPGSLRNTGRPPRGRRARPASVRSTRSLPLYNKEPGEQEVVIFRGADDMEDGTIQTTVILPPVDEHSEHTNNPSLDLMRSMSPSSAYVVVGQSGQDMPLLDGQESSEDHPRSRNAHLQAPNLGVPSRASIDTMTSEDAAGLMASPEVLERGEAPPYLEAIGMDSGVDLLENGRGIFENVDMTSVSERAMSPSTQDDHRPSSPPERSASQSSHQRSNSGRISGFFGGLFHQRNAANARMPMPPMPTRASRDRGNHTREGSGPSIASVSSSPHGAQINAPGRTHRPSHSGSGSVMSLTSSMFRARSNTHARELLNSPSTISLNSISSPLSHTLIRTEFTYPKAGPTPEQMKLISSLDSFARFGVPYGADAVAFAASASHMSLNPPPEFEEVAGSSRNNEGLGTPEVEGTSPSSVEPQPAPAENEISPETTEQSTQEPESVSAIVATEEPEGVSEVDTVPTNAPSDVEAGSQTLAEPTEASPAASLEAPKTFKVAAPPSAYKAFAPPSLRAVSRASSYTSFATAEEYHSSPSSPSTPDMTPAMTVDISDTLLSPSTPTTVELETSIASSPPTPRTITRHVHEETDMTITSSPPLTVEAH